MSDQEFTTIKQHWAHYLERDIPPHAQTFQVMSMKNAFAAGAASGIALALQAFETKTPTLEIRAHIAAIKELIKV